MNQLPNARFSPYELREVRPHTFIYEIHHALSQEICRGIVERFEAAREHHYPGRIGQTQTEDRSVKRSTDMTVSDKADWKDVDNIFFRSLGAALNQVRDRFPFFKGRFKDMGYAIQRTDPGGYYHWHIDGGSHEFAYRQLVALWYLNDVGGPGGETEFLYQQVKVKPEAGKLVLFPPFWTHEHRGVILEQGVKYIATTWVVFA